MEQELKQKLIRQAFLAQKKAYAPYSGFQVGAALLTESGKIYGGCNIENASYGACNCAERTAFFRAVYEGEKRFRAIAIAGKPKNAENFDFCAPCGICRQVMSEFCVPEEFEIILAVSERESASYYLKELLPLGFTGSSMKGKEENKK